MLPASPQSALLPFAARFESDGRYLDREEYLAISPLNGSARAPAVAYCDIGVRASLFATLQETYTGRVVAVYDGSLNEWALRPDLPLDRAGVYGQIDRSAATDNSSESAARRMRYHAP